MIYCIECDKKLGILKRYGHPALGKRFLVCGKCYTKIDENMQKWRKFCLLDALNIGLSKIEIRKGWNKNLSNNPPLQKWFNDLWVKI